MKMISSAQDLRKWIAEIRDFSQLRIQQVPVRDCRNWIYAEGKLQHETDGFFSVFGVRAHTVNPSGDATRDWVMIDQPEVGWLGFIVRVGTDGLEWLLQAKTEPGNVNDTHIAPTIQATRSNYQRLHGGKKTEFLQTFQNTDTFLSDGAHSEQGTFFLWKFNRNSVLALPKHMNLDLTGLPQWKWCSSCVLRELLSGDYEVNTDARSVIATAPWALLSNGEELFSAPVLALSYKSVGVKTSKDRVVDLSKRLTLLPASTKLQWNPVALNSLEGFKESEYGLEDSNCQEVLTCYEISVQGREVSNWCQPFLTTSKIINVTLFMRIDKHRAEFFVRTYREVGFGQRTEYGPSLHESFDTPPELAELVTNSNRKQLISFEQSDEGGRFMHVKTVYEIVLLNDIPLRNSYEYGEWIPLSVIEELVARPGTTTNELRTLVSLILSTQFNENCKSLN